jgi:lysophospholipase L1-like esterase
MPQAIGAQGPAQYCIIGGVMNFSLDGGATWAPSSGVSNPPREIAPGSQGKAKFCVLNGVINYSLDGGATWTPFGGGSSVNGNGGLVAPGTQGKADYCVLNGVINYSLDGGATWTPSSTPQPPLSGLAFWLRSDTGVTTSVGNATVWADTLSGGGASFSVTGTCPFVASSWNGKPGITMSPNNYFGNASSLLPAGAKTVIIVAKLADAVGGALFSSRGSSVLSILGPIGVLFTNVFSYSNGAANQNYVLPPMFPGQATAFGFRTDGTASQVLLSINGTDVAGAGQAYTTETGSAGTYVGRHATSAPNSATGDYLEVLAWNRVLTTLELATTQAYLAARYPAPAQPVMGLNPTITLAGDSITAGYNVGTASPDATFRWTVELEASLTAKYTAAGMTAPVYTNTAVVGQTTSGMLTNINAQLLTTPMTDLFLMIGVNDAITGLSNTTTASNIASILSQVRSTFPACRIWVFNPPFCAGENWPNGVNSLSAAQNDKRLDGVNLIIANALSSYLGTGAALLDMKAAMFAYEALNNPSHVSNGILTQSDGIHPSKTLGQTTMSAYAYGLIKTVAG